MWVLRGVIALLGLGSLVVTCVWIAFYLWLGISLPYWLAGVLVSSELALVVAICTPE